MKSIELENYIISEGNLELVKDKSLFYPCSGNDLLVPIEIFSPYITDFWFIDPCYFSETKPADKQPLVLLDDKRYKFKAKDIIGPPAWPSQNKDVAPCILTEAYTHLATNREIRIHRRRGYGFSALKNEHRIGSLGVFFYRGDSQGEGGSGNMWLHPTHLNDVLSKLTPNGLLVLDGSGGSGYKKNKRIYSQICKYNKQREVDSPEYLIASMDLVADKFGREFCCVGYAGMKNGPTMIWQVHGHS